MLYDNLDRVNLDENPDGTWCIVTIVNGQHVTRYPGVATLSDAHKLADETFPGLTRRWINPR